MNVLFISPEVWPFQRVGGLAEVAHDLPLALGKLGHRVDLVTPLSRLDPMAEERLDRTGTTLDVPVSWRSHRSDVFSLGLGEGVSVWFICHDHLFDREGLYGNAYGDYEDNAERFIFFSRASLELAQTLGVDYDVVHVHDWTTGLIPLYLKSFYQDQPSLARAGSLMTIHNLAAQGVFWHYDMPLTGLGWEYFTPEGVEFYGKINFLKAGLIFADLISTVSQTYAREMMTPEMGFGLEGVLQTRKERLQWVPNGIDTALWDPARDPVLADHFSEAELWRRDACRQDLRRRMELDPSPDRPLAALVGRLVDRKGLDILTPALEPILEMGLDVVIMGMGDDHYHSRLKEMAQRHQGRLAVEIGFSDELNRQIMAGSDIFIMPSRFEPCGMHQLQAMHYGCVPVVRATGGLNDSVEDHRPQSPGNGFKFTDYAPESLLEAVQRALAAYADPEQWQEIMRRGMNRDCSWEPSARRYLELYTRAAELRRAGSEVAS